MANSIWDQYPAAADFNKNTQQPNMQQQTANASIWDEFPATADFSNPEKPIIEPKHRIDKLRNMTHLEFMELPFNERAEISRELADWNKVDVGANIVEGLIPGGSHLVTKAREAGFLPQEAQEDAAKYGLGAVKLGASALPIGLIAKGINKLASPFEKGIEQAGKHAKTVADYTKAAFTGAAYKTAETSIGEQRAPTAGEVAQEAGLFMAGHGLAEGIGKVYERMRGTGKSPADITAQEITEQLFGPNEQVPASMYEMADNILNGIKAQEAGIKPPGPQLSPTALFPPGKPSQAPSLQGKTITKEAPKSLGIKATVLPKNPTTEEKALSTFRHQIENPYEAGKAIKETVDKADKAAYKIVNENYAKSDELQKSISDIQPNLVQEYQKIISDIDAIPSPSPIQKKLKAEISTVLKDLAEVEADGTITGYKSMTNHQLLEQVKAWRQLIDYDFAHGDPHNVFKLAIGATEEAALESAGRSGSKEAVKALETAKASYKEWADTFKNDYVNPFRDRTNKSFSKNFEGLQNPDHYNVIKNILEKSPEGKIQLESLQREIVDKELKAVLRDPRKIHPRDLDKKLNELKSILEPEQLDAIKNEIMQARQSQNMGFKAKKVSKEEALNTHMAKALKMEPEKLISKMNTRSGIKEVEQLAKDSGQLKNFDLFKKQKTRDIIYNGKLEAKPTGKEIADRLNSSANRELIVEMWGEDAFQTAFDAAKLLGEKEVTPQLWKEMLKKAAVKGAQVHYLGTLAAFIL